MSNYICNFAPVFREGHFEKWKKAQIVFTASYLIM